ncbi:MAG: DMT family transporter [Pseudomonadota bacterium]
MSGAGPGASSSEPEPSRSEAPSQEAAGGFAVAALLFGVTTFCFPTMDAIAKGLMSRYDPMQVVWARYASQTALMALIFLPSLSRLLRTGNLRLQLIRSALLFGATMFFFSGVAVVPLAAATATMFCAPLIITALAGPILGERVGPWRWSAVIIGFLGVGLILRPGGDAFQPELLLVLGAATCYGLYQLSTRFLAGSDTPITTLFYSVLLGTAAASLIAPFAWRTPTLADAGLMMSTGVIGGLGHFAMIQALRRAPASALAPFNYLALIWATLWGALFFANVPDAWTFAGAGVIVAAGLVIYWRERVRRPAAAGG